MPKNPTKIFAKKLEINLKRSKISIRIFKAIYHKQYILNVERTLHKMNKLEKV